MLKKIKLILLLSTLMTLGPSTLFAAKIIDGNNDGDPIPELIGPTVVVEAESAIAAADYLHGLYGVGQINCTRA